MSDAQKNLDESIKDLSSFVSHNMGPGAGTTSSFEIALLSMLRAAGDLRKALYEQERLPESLDKFEGSFLAMASLSGAVMHSALISRVSQTEVDNINEQIDAVRAEIGSSKYV